MFSLLSCLSTLNLPFYICHYDNRTGTPSSAFLLYQLTLCWALPIGGVRGWCQRTERKKEKAFSFFLSASWWFAVYIRFSPRRIFHLGGGRSFSLRSRWFKCDISPTLGKPALSHAPSYRHLHQLVDAPPPPLNVWVPASELLPANLLSFNNSSYFSLLPQSYRH